MGEGLLLMFGKEVLKDMLTKKIGAQRAEAMRAKIRERYGVRPDIRGDMTGEEAFKVITGAIVKHHEARLRQMETKTLMMREAATAAETRASRTTSLAVVSLCLNVIVIGYLVIDSLRRLRSAKPTRKA